MKMTRIVAWDLEWPNYINDSKSSTHNKSRHNTEVDPLDSIDPSSMLIPDRVTHRNAVHPNEINTMVKKSALSLYNTWSHTVLVTFDQYILRGRIILYICILSLAQRHFPFFLGGGGSHSIDATTSCARDTTNLLYILVQSPR